MEARSVGDSHVSYVVSATSEQSGESSLVSAWERAEQKRQAELDFDCREQDADSRNADLQAAVEALEAVLIVGVEEARPVNYESRLVAVPDPSTAERSALRPEPQLDSYIPPEPGLFAKLIPGWEERYRQKQSNRREHFEAAQRRWRREIADDDSIYQHQVEKLMRDREVAERHNEEIRRLADEAREGSRNAVEDYVKDALESSRYSFDVGFAVRYLTRKKELLLEVTYPPSAVVPSVSSWAHIKSRKVVEAKLRSSTDTNAKYRELIARVTIRAIYEALRADCFRHISTVSFKGKVRGVSELTGRQVSPTVVSLRVERDLFLDRNFTRVNPVKILKSFRANVSDEPMELKAVPLVVEFDIDDPRVIEEEDIISKMDDRDNLMDLTYAQFESFIVNLFTAMGFEARQTVRSKDGGVDCIAVYRDPVGVTKFVIQAKQWSQVVKVDAIRDLYGTMTHERAGKSVLVTTSKVSAGGWKWADDKPMQIIEGPELLDLFERWTDRRVTIVFPPAREK